MNIVSKKVTLVNNKATLTDYFQEVENRVRDYYGDFANI